MKSEAIKNKAVGLRKDGHSYNYISLQTGISKSTLSDWLSFVPYKPNSETIKRIGAARAASGAAKHKIKLESITKALNFAKTDIGKISKRDLFMLGLGVYIGEGTKTGDDIRVINSNPAIIKLAIRWLMEICDLNEDNFRIRLHLYPDSNERDCKNYWANYTGIPLANFRKTQIDRRIDKKRINFGKLPYGTAHLQIKSNGKKEHGVFLGRRIRAWMDIVLNV